MSGSEILIIALLVAAYIPALDAMREIWDSVEYFSHGYLILPVALAIAWTRRQDLAEALPRRDWRGLLALAASLGLYFFGLLTDQVSVLGLAFVSGLAGAVLLLKGPGWLRVLAFPLAYLLFMVPIPPEWITPAISRLRLFVSNVVIDVLHALSLPVAQEGNVISVPGGELFVAEACSGITSMVTLLPVAVLLGYFTQTRLWPRLALVAAVVPIAMLGNLLRVFITILAALEMGPQRATAGALHESAGALTYLFGCLVLLAVDALIRRVQPPGNSAPAPA